MRIVSYNIYDGGIGRIDPIAEVLRALAPDVVVLPEATDRTELEKLADRLGMDAFIAANPKCPAKEAVGFLSRLPILEAVNHTPLDSRITRATFHATVRLPSGKPLTIIGLHLHARETLADEAMRLREIPAILEIAQHFQNRGQPHVLAGDFNAHHPDQPIKLSEVKPSTLPRLARQNNLIPRAAIQAVLDAGYLDAHALLHKPADFQTSFTTAFPAMRVDYIFVPPILRAAVTRCDYPRPGGDNGIARFASDHYAVVADLNL